MNSIKSLNNWKRSLLIICLPPVIWLGIIYIIYGAAFDSIFYGNSTVTNIFSLSGQFDILNSDIQLPSIVKKIGQISILSLLAIFILWVSSFSVYSYLKLSNQVSGKFELLLELVIISIVYFFIAYPVNILLVTFGWIVLGLNYALISVYWVYEIRTKR